MVSYAGFSMDYVKQWRCISKDIIDTGSQMLTSDEEVNKELSNGDEVYDFEARIAYIYDEENDTLHIQK